MSLNRGRERAEGGKQEPLEHVLVMEKVDRKEGPRASSLFLLPSLPLHNFRSFFVKVSTLANTPNPGSCTALVQIGPLKLLLYVLPFHHVTIACVCD